MKNILTFSTLKGILATLFLALALSVPAAYGSCGNGVDPSNQPCTPPDQPPGGCSKSQPNTPCPIGGSVDPYTGNGSESVLDLNVFGAVGNGLKWQRFINTRIVPGTGKPFGEAANLRHLYQWEMFDNGPTSYTDPVTGVVSSLSRVQVYLPQGGSMVLTQTPADPNTYVGAANIGVILVRSGNNYTLQFKEGTKVLYSVVGSTGSGNIYRAMSVSDAFNNTVVLSYDAEGRLVTISEPAGRYLTLSYTNSTATLDNGNWSTLDVISTAPTAGQFTTYIPTGNAGAPRYLRLRAATTQGSFHVAEIQFYDKNNKLISGTPFGSIPNVDSTTSFTNAFDGNTGTIAAYTAQTGGFFGIDPGSFNTIASIRIYPAPGYENELVGATIEGSETALSSSQLITQVTASDGRNVKYGYTKLVDPSLPNTIWNELTSVSYSDGTQSVLTYAQTRPGVAPVLTYYYEPRVNSRITSVIWNYSPSGPVGQVSTECNPLSGVAMMTRVDQPDGHTEGVSYANGQTALYQFWGGTAEVTTIFDSFGKKSSFLYSAGNNSGFLISSTDRQGNTTTYTRDSWGRILTANYPGGTVETFTYDLNGQVLVHVLDGKTTTYVRDAYSRPISVTFPDGTTEAFTYNNFGQVLTHTLKNGGIVVNTYDAFGDLLTTTDPLGNVTTKTYNALSLPASVTDPLGHATTFNAYNEQGQLLNVTYADGSTASNTFDPAGNLIASIDELGHTKTATYDVFERKTSSTDALGRTTTISYMDSLSGCSSCNTQEKPSLITLPSGKQIKFNYDVEWRMTSTIVGFGTADAATTTNTFDNVDNVLTSTDPIGHKTSFVYDGRYRTTSVTDPRGNKTSFTYDPSDNNLTITDALNRVTSNTFDSMNRKVSSTDPKNQKTTFAFDSMGNISVLTDAKGQASSWQYDLDNRNIKMSYADGSFEMNTFDPASRLISWQRTNGIIASYTYDSRNRMLATTWSDSTPGVTKSYDAASRLLTSANSVSSCGYSYDAANELLSETQTVANIHQPWLISYSYDLDGNRINLIYPSGVSVGYSYTNRNQISSISQGSIGLAQYAYDLDGNVLNKSLANGTQVSFVYDLNNNLTTLNNTLSGISFARFDYGYNAVNMRTFEQRDSAKGDVFSYDQVDQVTGVNYDTTNPSTTATGPDRTVSYSFDTTGNRSNVVDSVNGTSSYTANNLNQYTTVGASVLSYDLNGNLATGNNGGLYLYDSQNRLLTAKVGGKVGTIDQFSYDSKNRVVERQVNAAITYLIYDGWNLIEERDSNGNVLATYIHGVLSDEMLSKTASGATVYYHTNALGSVTDLTSSTGAVIEKYKYDIYGKPAISNGSGSPLTVSAYGNRFMFTGREFLVEVSLYDYRNRMYSADLGRFLQRDPIGFDGGDVNIYRYCDNNVVNWIDLFGLDLYTVTGVAGSQSLLPPPIVILPPDSPNVPAPPPVSPWPTVTLPNGNTTPIVPGGKLDDKAKHCPTINTGPGQRVELKNDTTGQVIRIGSNSSFHFGPLTPGKGPVTVGGGMTSNGGP